MASVFDDFVSGIVQVFTLGTSEYENGKFTSSDNPTTWWSDFMSSATGADAAQKEKDRQEGVYLQELKNEEERRANEMMQNYRADVMASRSAQAAQVAAKANATEGVMGQTISTKLGDEQDFLGL